METVLLIAGLTLAVIGGLVFLVAAFQENLLWGFGCLLFGPVSLVFLILHWPRAKRGFFIQLCAIPFILLAYWLAPGGG